MLGQVIMICVKFNGSENRALGKNVLRSGELSREARRSNKE